jgi:IPT/TIG domain
MSAKPRTGRRPGSVGTGLGYAVSLIALLAACCALASPPLAMGVTFPQVTHVEANNGPQAGGNTVTLSGVSLSGQSPVRSVSFGGHASPKITVVSESTVTAVAPAGSGEVEVRVTNSRSETSPDVPADHYAYDPPPSGPWLGLNGNSSPFLGPIDKFVEDHVVYDRSGAVEWVAGESLSEGGSALATSINAGMIPIVTIEFLGYSSCGWESECLPTSESGIKQYVAGFIRSAKELIAKYPAAGIVFEAINEPWGYGTPAQYAAILAQLLPEAARAQIPLAHIYAAAATAEGWVQALYRARPQLQSEVKGWYLHPYNLRQAPGAGMAAVPGVQAEMTSGQNNLIVTEIGFCAPNVNKSRKQCKSAPAPARSSKLAAKALTAELMSAVPYHQAGWLRALVVYSRNDGGWAMQLTGGALTKSGEALLNFAKVYG